MNRDILNIGLDPILQFEAVARRKSLKEAAGELFLSQPAVTHALNKLENSLGVQLCIRNRSTFALTEPGKKLYASAQKIKAELKTYQSFLSQSDSFDGMLSIGLLDNLHNQAFEHALEMTLLQYPKMQLNLQVYSATDIQNMISLGELDIGLGIFNNQNDKLTYHAVGEENISCFISEHHELYHKKTLKRSDFNDSNYTWVDLSSRTRQEIENEILVAGKKPPMKVSGYTNNLHSALMILGAGSSVVPLPTEYIDSRDLHFSYRKLDEIFKPYSIKQSLVFNQEFAEASLAAKFLLNQVDQSLTSAS